MESLFRESLDVIKSGDTLSPSKIALAIAERVMIARGRFVRRGTIPAAFYAVVIFHAVCVVCLLAYPFATRSRDLDGMYFVVLGLVYLHWVVCYGECILGWAEKRLYYEKYALGDAPLHFWFMDAFSLPVVVAIVASFLVVSWTGVARVLFRNVIVGKGEIGFSLKFGSTSR